jgi:integrase
MSKPSIVLLDAAGRRRSPATVRGYLAGRAPRNKGMEYPADPPKPEEIILVMRRAGADRHGLRIRALTAVLWRGGLRISEALALNETDVDERRGSLLVRHGKGDKQTPRSRHGPIRVRTAQRLAPRIASNSRPVRCSASSTAPPAAGAGQTLRPEPRCVSWPLTPVYGDGSRLISSATPTPSNSPAKGSRSTSSNASSGTPILGRPRWVGPGRGAGVATGPFPRPARRTGRAHS